MEIDSSFTIAGIIAVVSLISPIITTIISNRYELKKRKIDTYYSKQCQALDDFIKLALNYYGQTLTWGQMVSYTSAFNSLYLYFNITDNSLFIQLDNYRDNSQLVEYKKTLNKIVKKLSQQIVKI